MFPVIPKFDPEVSADEKRQISLLWFLVIASAIGIWLGLLLRGPES